MTAVQEVELSTGEPQTFFDRRETYVLLHSAWSALADPAIQRSLAFQIRHFGGFEVTADRLNDLADRVEQYLGMWGDEPEGEAYSPHEV